MAVLVTYHKTGVDGKACVVGKESNTKSLTKSIRTMMVITVMMNKTVSVTLLTPVVSVGNIVLY